MTVRDRLISARTWLNVRVVVSVPLGWLIAVGIVLLVVLAASSADAAQITVKQTLAARQSNGRFDAEYPTGNDSAPLAWAGIPNIQLRVGDSCAINLRTLGGLSGSNAGTATLAKASGTLPAGCSTATDGLQGTATTITSPAQLQWRATDGTPVDSNIFTLEVLAASGADTTPPAEVTGCVAVGGTGTVTLTCHQSSDPYVGGLGRGVASYKIYLNGAATPIATVTAPSANVQAQWSAYAVGGANGTQSHTQSGADRTLSSGGTGLGSTTDQLYALGATISNSTRAVLKLQSFSGSITTATAGWMLRVDPNDAGSAMATCRQRDSDDKVNNRYRASAGAAAGNGTLTAALTRPLWLMLEYDPAAGVTCSTSANGNDFTASETARAGSFGATPYLLAFHASGTSGTTTTADLRQLNVAPTATWSYQHTTNSGGNYQVTAVDSNGNESAKGAAITAAPSEPSPDTACTGDPAPQLMFYDDFDSSPAGTTAWTAGTYAAKAIRKSPLTGYDYYCKTSCSGSTDPSQSSSWAPIVDTARWNANNCLDYDAFAPSQDSCPAPSPLRARDGARSLRTQLTYHAGSSTTPAALWVSGTTYAIGDERASTSNFARYRRTTTGAGTTDPRFDPSNWAEVQWYYKADGTTPSGDNRAHRSELSMKEWLTSAGGTGYNSDTLNVGDEAWYGFSLFVPASGDANGDPALDLGARQSYVFPWQLHDAPDPGEISRNPPAWLSFYGPDGQQPSNLQNIDPTTALDPEYWRFGGWYDADAIQLDRKYDGSYGAGNALGKWKPTDQGKWTDFVIRYRANYTAAGITQIWKDGTLVYSYTGGNAPNDLSFPYQKIGIYSGRITNDADPVPRDWPKRIVYYLDSYKMAVVRANPAAYVTDSNCAYQMVAPTGTSH